MPRQLYVLRHAKSSWEDPALEDRERPLTPRGFRTVKALSKHLRASGIAPDQVLCSPARRTRETHEGVDPPGELLVEEALYEATADEVIDRLRHVPDSMASVMVIGHNPALQMLVLKLARDDSDPKRLSAVLRKFPTGGLATLEFDRPWSELSAGSARLLAIVRPRDLH